MTVFLLAVAGVLALAVLVTGWMVIVRPNVFDRVIGIGVIGTKTTVLLAITGALFGRLDAFVDISLTYALLNFVFTLAVAKYITRRQNAS